MTKRIGLLVLAAGQGSRMGSPKQLLNLGGKPMVRYVVENGLLSVCRPVVVVIGANADSVRTAVEGTGVETVDNPRWNEGMGTSIQAGLRVLEMHHLDGLILMLADQPLVSGSILNRLVDLHIETRQPIVAAEYAGTVGVPVLFSSRYFGHLRELAPDNGCKSVILTNRSEAALLACPEAEADVDTQEDYRRVLELLTGESPA